MSFGFRPNNTLRETNRNASKRGRNMVASAQRNKSSLYTFAKRRRSRFDAGRVPGVTDNEIAWATALQHSATPGTLKIIGASSGVGDRGSAAHQSVLATAELSRSSYYSPKRWRREISNHQSEDRIVGSPSLDEDLDEFRVPGQGQALSSTLHGSKKKMKQTRISSSSPSSHFPPTHPPFPVCTPPKATWRMRNAKPLCNSKKSQSLLYPYSGTFRCFPTKIACLGTAQTGKSSGLQNLGNTCYLNAVLQAILGLTPLLRDLRSSSWQQTITSAAESSMKTAPPPRGKKSSAAGAAANPALGNPFPEVKLTPELLRLSYAIEHCKSSIKDLPRFIKTIVAKHSSRFIGHEQEDAHEFFLDLINLLHDELYSLRRFLPDRIVPFSSSVFSSSASYPSNPAFMQAVTSKPGDHGRFRGKDNTVMDGNGKDIRSQVNAEERKLYEMLPTTRNLHSEIQVTFQCIQCQKTHHVTELYRDISVDLPPGQDGYYSSNCRSSSPVPVSQLLASFFKPEMRELRCDKCKCEQFRVSHCFDVLPRVLVIHLKRFQVDPARCTYVKSHTPVVLEPSIDLKQFCTKGASNMPIHDLGPIGDAKTGVQCLEVVASYRAMRRESWTGNSNHLQKYLESQDGMSPPTPVMAPAPLSPSLRSPSSSSLLSSSSSSSSSSTRKLSQSMIYEHVSDKKKRERNIARLKRKRNFASMKLDRDIQFKSQDESLFGKSKTMALLLAPQVKGKEVCDFTGSLLSEEEKILPKVQEMSKRKEEEQHQLNQCTERNVGMADPILSDNERCLELALKISRCQDESEHVDPSHEKYQARVVEVSVKEEVKQQGCEDSELERQQKDERHVEQRNSISAAPELPLVDMDLTRGEEGADVDASPLAQAVTFVSKSNTPLQTRYDLKCVVRHLGSAAFAGHYNTDVRGCTDSTEKKDKQSTVYNVDSGLEEGAWSRFDDLSVEAGLSQASVLDGDKNQRSAYLLFYVQRVKTTRREGERR